MYYFNIFFIYSFLGFLFETLVWRVINPGFHSGILYGPWTFIYGIGVLVMMGLYRFIKQFKIKKWLEVILFYFGITILMTLLEFIGGNLIEKLFHMTYWDYISLHYNYGFYISLEVSLLWGLFATIMNYAVLPRLNRMARKVPKWITVLLIILFLLDVILSFIKLIK